MKKTLTIDFKLYEQEKHQEFRRGVRQGISLFRHAVKEVLAGADFEMVSDIFDDYIKEEDVKILKDLISKLREKRAK